MNTKQYFMFTLAMALILLAQIEAHRAQERSARAQQTFMTSPLMSSVSSSTVSSLLDRIRGADQKMSKPEAVPSINDVNDTEIEDEEDGDEEEEDVEDDSTEVLPTAVTQVKKPEPRAWTDMFGNQLKIDENRTTLVLQNQARDLGLLTLKAIILGPLIGLTIKAALIRGLLWALGAYLLHLFFPALLSSLGLGTGLVGFARQMQPNIAQLVLPHLANFTMCAIDRSQGIAS